MAPPPAQPTNGLLPVPAAVLQKQSPPSNAPRGAARSKPASPRTKAVIRRLPPGLTEEEFQDILGDEWKVGGEKVDWFQYKPGKISKDLAKPSYPSTAYLHVTDSAHLKPLSDNVLQLSFIDAKNSSRDPALVGPPSLEFAPNSKISSSKRRNDARQGTIDQDPDFIEFLQSLTDPIVKPVLSDTEGAAKREVVRTTPLIEHIREKKAAAKERPSAAKAAAVAAAKHGRQETKESPKADSKSPAEKQDKKTVKPLISSPEKGKKLTKAQKAAQEAVKVLNREVAAVTSSAAPPPERRRDRVAPAISVAAKIQRDLGLAPAGRRRREPASEPQPAMAESSRENVVPSSAPTGPLSTTASVRKEPRPPRGRRSSKTAITEKSNNEQAPDASKKTPTGPAQPTILRKPVQPLPPRAPAATLPNPPQGPKAQMPQLGPAGSPQPNTSSTPPPTSSTSPSQNRQAFLKHANPSQGITEVLIEEALSVFGKVDTVEIDRKKGFAYVTFGDNETLRKACSAGSVKVAQGAVQVLERRDRPGNRHIPMAPVQMQRGGFRGRGGRGGRGGRIGMNTVPVSPVVPGGPSAAAPIARSPAPSPAPTPTPAVDV